MSRALILAVAVVLASPLYATPDAASNEEARRAGDPFLVHLKGRSFRPKPGVELGALTARKGGADGRVHFLVQLEQLPQRGKRLELEGQGVRILSSLGGRTYLASAPAHALTSLGRAKGIRWAGPLLPADKVGRDLAANRIPSWARARDGRVAVTLQVHGDSSLEEAEALVTGLGGTVVGRMPSVPALTALLDAAGARRLAEEDAAHYVDVADPPLGPTNDGARAAANAVPLAAAPYNLTGAGATILVYDVGQVDPAHTDFTGRLLENDGSTVSQHATHVAGTAAGSGANSTGNDSAGNPNGGAAGQWAGMAPAAGIRTFGISGLTDVLYDDNGGDLATDFATALGNGVDIATMSLGNNVVSNGFPCAQLGDYTNTSILIDGIVTGSIGGQRLIYFEAAGNERQSGSPCSSTGFSTIGSPATAKNSIAVGAINSNDNSMTGFSSFGPTDDGRLKPDLVAPGCQSNGDTTITSPTFVDLPEPGFPNGDDQLDTGETQNTYVGLCGTSMATPAAAGASALVLEQWQRTRGATSRPLPHTMKAILVHTATDLGNPGPDYQFGFGALNAQAAVDLVIADDDGARIHVDQADNGETFSRFIESDGLQPVQATLAWDDPAASRLSTTQLVNDLDLRLVDPDGVIYQPLVLNAAAPATNAAPGTDASNNVELAIGAAKAGRWEVRVVGAAVPSGPQGFTLVTSAAAFANRPPVADAGGPYATDEGANVLLSGLGSSDPDGDALTFAWDLDGDGQFDDASAALAVFDRVGQDGVFTVALRVTEPGGGFSVDEATVTVTNVSPSVSLSFTGSVGEAGTTTLDGSAVDAGWLDPLSATVDWGDGAGAQLLAGALENVRPDATLSFGATHVYGDNGAFTVTVCAADDDGATCRSAAVVVTNVDPTAAIDTAGALPLGGTPTFLVGEDQPLTLSGRSTDPGSDDLRLAWDFGDGPPAPDVEAISLVNPPLTDPFPSPSLQPRDVTDTRTHSFDEACLYTIAFRSADDDGGQGEAQALVVVTGSSHERRGAGFWKQQYRAGHGWPRRFSDATLQCYLEVAGRMSRVIHEVRDASTFPAAFAVLDSSHNHGDVRRQLDRQLLAAWLNFANGAIDLDDRVDTDDDDWHHHPPRPTFAEVMATAEAVRLDPSASRQALERQKETLEDINEEED